MSQFHGMDGDMSILKRIARRLSLHRQGDIKRGDVVVPTVGTAFPPITLEALVSSINYAVVSGKQTNTVIEDILSAEDKFGACWQSGSECTNPNCRVCARAELVYRLKAALIEDVKLHLVDLTLR